MLELIEEVSIANNLLTTALDRYLDACSAIGIHYAEPNSSVDVAQAFAACISTELPALLSFEIKIKQAKSIISRARNSSTALTPIHSLPSEILARIFQVVVGTTCEINIDCITTSPPRYPDFLAHVCSRWRLLVTSLPALWSHVDLTHFHPSSQKFINRAETFVSLANDLPLEVHVRIPISYDINCENLIQHFIPLVAARTRSLRLEIPDTVADFSTFTYELLLKSLRPGNLQHLEITDHGQYTPDYLATSYEGDGDDEEVRSLPIFIPKKVFEDLLFPVKVLRLSGLYPLWSSLAYHGLVELRLSGPSEEAIDITVVQLYNIITSCPKLAILDIGIYIIDDFRTPSYIQPVSLDDLEELHLAALPDQADLQLVMPWIAPGPKPLQLAIQFPTSGSLSPESDHFIAEFLRQSNTTRLWMSGFGQHLEIGELSSLLPQLKVLALDSFSIESSDSPAQGTIESVSSAPSLSLDVLYAENTEFELDYLHRLVERHSIRAMVFWRSYVYRNGKGVPEDEVTRELSSSYPVIKFVDDGGSRPTADWGCPL